MLPDWVVFNFELHSEGKDSVGVIDESLAAFVNIQQRYKNNAIKHALLLIYGQKYSSWHLFTHSLFARYS